MKNQEPIRLYKSADYITVSPLSEQFGIELYEIDPNAAIRLGSFSKARTKMVDSLAAAVESAKGIRGSGCKSDLLIKQSLTQRRTESGWKNYHLWQVWERRTHVGYRVATVGGGSRMPKKEFGTGKIYIM